MNALITNQQVLQGTAGIFSPDERAAESSPTARGLLGGLFACYAINKTSSLLSHYVLNNWHSAEPWNSQQELVLITGGSSGIGQKIAEDLSERGVKVVIIDIQELESTLVPNVSYEADVTSTDSIKAVAERIRAKHSHPTVLVNNAAVFANVDEPESMIWKSFRVNTLAHFLTVKEFLPACFITVGEMVDYACTKASALAFHDGLSQEIRHWYGATKVRTSIVNPLWVRTPLIRNLTDAGDSFDQPIMDTEVVSDAVVKHILARSFPLWLQEWLRSSLSLKVMRVRNEFWSRKSL
ncbi:hypothetical protein SI65_06225 [Aspergillus cristatus]|uniref:Uncharacterized protein n=1 Tax=Aspergillus cristatus TaxID=573508 RepID=A0A1E3BBP0_ASPCR|nr:hypothetical protein SI65_06225 [Aspergillus cristatus]